jgi:2-polyprenyl-3-methyl-5-hydroxy-6-metoxy-1,4-benzoquinol methylase
MNNSWKTAIGRTKLSFPLRYLLSHGRIDLLNDKVLDFGCGRGFDADCCGFTKYDPHFFPERPEEKFDVALCNYVLNVLPKSQEIKMINEIRSYLKKPFGIAYITVRRNIKNLGVTPKGTYQRNVVLNNLPVEYEDSDLCIYTLYT